MNKKIQILGAFLLGIICAMVYNYFYNMNGRYIPIRTKYGNVRMSVLDTRTGNIYVETSEDGKKNYNFRNIIELGKENKEKEKKETK